jgi:hypothetical protein
MLEIKVARPKDLKALMAKAIGDAEEHGIEWTGDPQQGLGAGYGFEGCYVVDEEFITVYVLKKPLLIPNATIEREVRRYLGGA